MPLAPFLPDPVVVASHVIGAAIRTRVRCMSCDPLQLVSSRSRKRTGYLFGLLSFDAARMVRG